MEKLGTLAQVNLQQELLGVFNRALARINGYACWGTGQGGCPYGQQRCVHDENYCCPLPMIGRYWVNLLQLKPPALQQAMERDNLNSDWYYFTVEPKYNYLKEYVRRPYSDRAALFPGIQADEDASRWQSWSGNTFTFTSGSNPNEAVCVERNMPYGRSKPGYDQNPRIDDALTSYLYEAAGMPDKFIRRAVLSQSHDEEMGMTGQWRWTNMAGDNYIIIDQMECAAGTDNDPRPDGKKHYWRFLNSMDSGGPGGKIRVNCHPERFHYGQSKFARLDVRSYFNKHGEWFRRGLSNADLGDMHDYNGPGRDVSGGRDGTAGAPLNLPHMSAMPNPFYFPARWAGSSTRGQWDWSAPNQSKYIVDRWGLPNKFISFGWRTNSSPYYRQVLMWKHFVDRPDLVNPNQSGYEVYPQPMNDRSIPFDGLPSGEHSIFDPYNPLGDLNEMFALAVLGLWDPKGAPNGAKGGHFFSQEKFNTLTLDLLPEDNDGWKKYKCFEYIPLVERFKFMVKTPEWQQFIENSMVSIGQAWKCGAPIMGHSAGSSVINLILRLMTLDTRSNGLFAYLRTIPRPLVVINLEGVTLQNTEANLRALYNNRVFFYQYQAGSDTYARVYWGAMYYFGSSMPSARSVAITKMGYVNPETGVRVDSRSHLDYLIPAENNWWRNPRRPDGLSIKFPGYPMDLRYLAAQCPQRAMANQAFAHGTIMVAALAQGYLPDIAFADPRP